MITYTIPSPVEAVSSIRKRVRDRIAEDERRRIANDAKCLEDWMGRVAEQIQRFGQAHIPDVRGNRAGAFMVKHVVSAYKKAGWRVELDHPGGHFDITPWAINPWDEMKKVESEAEAT